ncbi:hypothetical protein TYRP_018811 [Tyrophagus putrescentiae]|nr:hypothetical protein TYRP_018811 [Tyrophagus putrescentiae]
MSQNESSQPLLGEENIDQGNVNIQQMFDFQRFETNLDIFFACLYFPIGICLFIIRLFIFIQVLLISTLLPKDSYARSYIFRSMFFVLGIIVQEEDFNLKNCKAQLVVSNRVSDFDPLVVNLIYPFTIFNVRYLASLDKAENETADEYTKRVQLKMASCTNLVASSFDNSDKKEMMKRIQDEHNRRYSHSYRVSSTPSVDDMAIKGKEAMPQVPPDTSKSDTEITENAEELAYYLGRLKLYEEILQKQHGILHKDHFDCNFYNEFRKKSLLELAISFANQADTVALAVLLKRERTTLVNHLLVIISNFPETVSPEEYKDIIDVLFGFYLNSKTDFTSFQPASWSEELTTNFNPAQIESDFCNKFYSEHEKYKSYIIDHYLSEEMLTSWFKDRALEILNFTSLVDNSLQLLEYGMDQNLNVAELYHQLDLYSLLIYESAEQTLSSFKEFEDLSVIDKMNLILRKHDASYAIENLFEKFIEKLSKNANNKVDKKTLLREFMVDLTKTDFKQCLKIFESCSMVDKTLEQAESLKTICDACDLVELAIDCIRAYENPSNLEFAFRIMECLPERSQAALLMGENPSKVRQFNRVNDQADQIEYYLSMLEVLRDYGTNITVKDLEAIVNSKTTTAAQKFFEKVIKNFCSTSFSATADISLEWKNFFWNLQDLRKNCLSALTSEQLVELCVNSLLFSGNKVYIQLALHHIIRRWLMIKAERC